MTITRWFVHVRFRYASSDDRPLRLSVDGEEDLLAPSLPFAGTGSWIAWRNQDHKVDLKKGKRRIRLTSIVNRGPNVDRMEVVELKKADKLREIQPTAKPTMDDQWHLVCLSFDGKKARLYLDGALNSEEASEATLSGKVSLDVEAGIQSIIWTNCGSMIDRFPKVRSCVCLKIERNLKNEPILCFALSELGLR